MQKRTVADWLWGFHAKLRYVFLAALILLFGLLSSHEIWTQEHRWADIVSAMFYYHDFFHPWLNGVQYYDKPLLSYWLIVGFSKLFGQLSLLTLRLPSALSGLLAIGSIYSIGKAVRSKTLGLMAAWFLLTTYYFVFWGRVSSADMLNLAGTLFAVAWYIKHRERPRFFSYVIFFLILALTALCKGLVGPVVALLAVFPDVLLRKKLRQYLDVRLFFAAIPALTIYILPFWISSHYNNASYGENGLYEVYRENILRYFQPFDHKGPFYTYFIYLPIYLLPSVAFFFVPAILSIRKRWRTMDNNAKWIVLATGLLFLFFTFSGSRRSYYVLPIVPFAILLTADWILSAKEQWHLWAGRMTAISFVILFFIFIVIQPIYYLHGGFRHFSTLVKTEANKIRPWKEWKVILLGPELKVNFYLALPPTIKYLSPETTWGKLNDADILEKWPVLSVQPKDTIIISRKLYAPLLQEILKNYKVIEAEPTYLEILFNKKDPNLPVAFIPQTNLKKMIVRALGFLYD